MFETATTELWLLYAFVIITFALFFLSIYCWYMLEADIVAFITMFLSTILNFKISNLFVDGTLSKTLITDAGEPVVQIIRNSAASSIFEFFAIITALLAVVQILTILKESSGVGKDEEEFFD